MNNVSLFLDSGAFSAWSKNLSINIDDYIKFIICNESYIDYYSVLDDINDPEITLSNQKYMESKGLNPIPCYHYNENEKFLEYYLGKYKYIALGGMVPISTKDLIKWLDKIFTLLCPSSNNYLPTHKIHGFGMTSFSLMLRYPWYSVDSTSWVLTGRFGSVYVPKKKNGEYNYLIEPWKVTVSNRSPGKEDEGRHFNSFTQMEQNHILEYFDKQGYKIGKSEIRKVKDDYKLEDDERWLGKEEADSQRSIHGERDGFVKSGWTKDKMVELVTEPGLSNDYKLRDELNIQYFLDLEKALPEWPWAFKLKQSKGFGLS